MLQPEVVKHFGSFRFVKENVAVMNAESAVKVSEVIVGNVAVVVVAKHRMWESQSLMVEDCRQPVMRLKDVPLRYSRQKSIFGMQIFASLNCNFLPLVPQSRDASGSNVCVQYRHIYGRCD